MTDLHTGSDGTSLVVLQISGQCSDIMQVIKEDSQENQSFQAPCMCNNTLIFLIRNFDICQY